jgi:hypothetical protein
VSFAGDFIVSADNSVSAGTIHHFDLNIKSSGLSEVNTFDLFDTLVARHCYEPVALFRQVEVKSGISGFAELRRSVEGQMYDRRDYSLDDVYAELALVSGWSADTIATLRMLELT